MVGDELFIHQDISFQDPDGDAFLVTYAMLWTTLSTIHVEDDPITALPDAQRAGAIVTATWRCGRTPHQVMLRAWILDRAGQRSQPVDLLFSCP